MILSKKQEKQQLWIQRKIHWIDLKVFLTEGDQCPLLDIHFCSLWILFQREVPCSAKLTFSLFKSVLMLRSVDLIKFY